MWDADEYRADLSVDPNALDLECLRQPETFFKYAEAAIEARHVADRAKQKLDYTEAALQIQCRNNPAAFGLAKATEGAVKAAVILHEDYDAAVKRYNDSMATVRILDKAVAAMEQKKRMLEGLITLHGQQYFAGPATPRNLPEAYAAQQAAADEASAKKQKRRARRRKKAT